MPAPNVNRRRTRLFRTQARTTSSFLRELRRQRELAGYTQQQIADLLEVSASTISRIESGLLSPTLRQVGQYAVALGANVSFTVTSKSQIESHVTVYPANTDARFKTTATDSTSQSYTMKITV